MKVETVIQHHPARAALLPAVLRQFRGRCRAIIDPDPDNALASPWRTYRACLEAAAPDTTHLIVLQDDVELCAGFEQAATAALSARPGVLVTFFVAGTPLLYVEAVWRASEEGRPWACIGNGQWAPAIALAWPVAFIPDLLAYVDRQGWPPEFRADDEIIGRWLRHTGREMWSTVPNLVQHPDTVESLLGKRHFNGAEPDRVSTCWNPGCDATRIDWTA